MYAFTLACYKAGVKDIDLHLKVMACGCVCVAGGGWWWLLDGGWRLEEDCGTVCVLWEAAWMWWRQLGGLGLQQLRPAAMEEWGCWGPAWPPCLCHPPMSPAPPSAAFRLCCRLQMMAQPPYDEKMDPFYLLHYTYGETRQRRRWRRFHVWHQAGALGARSECAMTLATILQC